MCSPTIYSSPSLRFLFTAKGSWALEAASLDSLCFNLSGQMEKLLLKVINVYDLKREV